MKHGSSSSGVESVLRACRILQSFRSEAELLRLRDVVSRTGLSKATAHRLLATLEQGGMIERAGPSHYRRQFAAPNSKPVRIGFAGQTFTSTFSRLVSESIRRAAAAYRLELIELDNRHSVKIALKNADLFISRRVDVVLEFQGYENVAPVIASRFLDAGIPVIAIEIPHPGATYFGANNYQAGLIGGRALAKWTRREWHGSVDQILLLEERIAGALPCSRVSGMLAGIHAGVPAARLAAVHHFDGNGSFRASYEAVRKHLRTHASARILVAANNDPSALGALRAFEDAGYADECAVISQNSIPEAREELRRPGTRLIGSVAYFPERYGDELIPLALAIANRQRTPPAVFVKHVLVTPDNVDRLYPTDIAPSKSLAYAAAAGTAQITMQ